MKWWAILNIALLTAAIVLPVVALVYCVRAFSWGFRHFPKRTGAVAVLLAIGLIVAALAFHRPFANCGFVAGFGVRCYRAG